MKDINAVAVISRQPNGELDFRIKGRRPFLKLVGDFILENQETCEAYVRVRRSALPKTNEQLGYYFGVVCHYACQGFLAAGFEFMDFRKADYELRMNLFFDEWETPQGKRRYPRSLETADILDVSEFIDNAIVFCSLEFSIAVPPPDKNHDQKL